MADLIDRGDPHDPIARQFVPDARELDRRAGGTRAIRSATMRISPVEGIVHRYPDRVLLKLVNVCAVYCRFCFRREMVGPGGEGSSPAALAAALDYIRGTSGNLGSDPDRRRSAGAVGAAARATVMRQLAAIDHVKVIRVHTRVPVVAPERDLAALVRALRADGKATYRRAARQSSARTRRKRPAPPARASSTPAFRCSSQSVLLRGRQ